jgi:hypothetical protein
MCQQAEPLAAPRSVPMRSNLGQNLPPTIIAVGKKTEARSAT